MPASRQSRRRRLGVIRSSDDEEAGFFGGTVEKAAGCPRMSCVVPPR